ncbi:fatty acid desaturase [Paracandidimonas soli]|uniref:Fatty acid desaturase n=2 Tax=Paracandidimonas soli TaxID=1917182 RepID=A0A4R3VCZ6_9BURK|nr:fatty acid desaturase [Paracandidimonas soli]
MPDENVGTGRWLPRLRHRRDWQSVAYMLAFPALAGWQWVHGFVWWMYGLLLFLTLGVGVIHHNHTHLRMWRNRRLNRLTDFWLTLLQGHPTCVFWPSHVANHHRHKHGEKDVTRTYRFGDTNHLWGYLWHPFQAVGALYPHIFRWLGSLRRHWPGVWRYCLLQYVAWLGSWSVLLWMDPGKALLFVILPQLHGLHWLLATNYLQHAHADGSHASRHGVPQLNYARNFEGLVNPLLFNIGLHTAHHEHSRAHWSKLTRLHAERYRHRVHPALNERGLLPYMFRTFWLGLALPGCRSRSLMPDSSADATPSSQQELSHARRF